MADDTVIRPPDQIAAGGSAQPPEQGGIMDALRSRGPAPQAALANIMQAPNVGLAAGSGALAALPGGAGVGQNPYLAGVQQQNKDAFYQALNQQRENRAQVDSNFRRAKEVMGLYKGILEDVEEGPTRDSVAKEYAKLVGKLAGPLGAGSGGGQVVGDIAQALATKKVDPKQVDTIIDLGARKVDPNLIALRTGVPVTKVQSILKTDPTLLAQMGADSAAERRDKDVQRKIHEATLIEKEAAAKLPPELKRGSPEFVEQVTLAFGKQNGYQKDYTEGTRDERARAIDAALKAIEERKAREDRLKAENILNRTLAAIGARTEAAATKAAGKSLLSPAMMKAADERFTKLDQMLQSIQELRAMEPELEKAGVFAQGEGFLSGTKAAYNQYIAHPFNDTVKRFNVLWPAFEVGQVSRGYFDEKGSRQKQAFEEQLKMGKGGGLPSKEGFEKYIAMMEGLAVDQMRRDRQKYETLGADPRFLETLDDKYMPYSGVPTREKARGGETPATGPLTRKPELIYNLKTGTWERPNAKD